MTQRYQVVKKDTGEVLADKEFSSRDEAVAIVKSVLAAGTGYKPDDIEGRIVGDTETKPAPEIVQEAVKSRKPRADKGQSHDKKSGYLVFNGSSLTDLMTKAETE
jgi:hypothetical protein